MRFKKMKVTSKVIYLLYVHFNWIKINIRYILMFKIFASDKWKMLCLRFLKDIKYKTVI